MKNKIDLNKTPFALFCMPEWEGRGGADFVKLFASEKEAESFLSTYSGTKEWWNILDLRIGKVVKANYE